GGRRGGPARRDRPGSSTLSRHGRRDRGALQPDVLRVLYAVLGGGRPRGASLETAPTNGHQGVSVRRLPPRGNRRAPGGGGGGPGGTRGELPRIPGAARPGRPRRVAPHRCTGRATRRSARDRGCGGRGPACAHPVDRRWTPPPTI